MTTTLELVGRVELGGLGVGRARHPRELLVEAEEVLEGDRRHRAGLLLDPHVLLGLDRLVQPVRPAAPEEHAARELVDDEDLAVVGHHVVDVALVEGVRAQALVEDVQRLEVDGIVEVALIRRVQLLASSTPSSVSVTECASRRRRSARLFGGEGLPR